MEILLNRSAMACLFLDVYALDSQLFYLADSQNNLCTLIDINRKIVPISIAVLSLVAVGLVTVNMAISSKVSTRVQSELPEAAGVKAQIPLKDLPENLTSDVIKAVSIYNNRYAKMLSITGYTQATSKGAALDPALSARRARAVKNFFIELGYPGKFRTSGAGRMTLNNPESRYVEVVTP
jgi:hypothetical protein